MPAPDARELGFAQESARSVGGDLEEAVGDGQKGSEDLEEAALVDAGSDGEEPSASRRRPCCFSRLLCGCLKCWRVNLAFLVGLLVGRYLLCDWRSLKPSVPGAHVVRPLPPTRPPPPGTLSFQCPPASPMIGAGICGSRATGEGMGNYCQSVPPAATYSVQNLTVPNRSALDCLMVITIGFPAELSQVNRIWNFTLEHLPKPRARCGVLRRMVFCKSFRSPECNVTFSCNIGQECIGILMAATDPRFRDLYQDGLLSVPANTLNYPERKQHFAAVLNSLKVWQLSPFQSYAQVGYDQRNWSLDRWKTYLTRADPRPLRVWSKAHLPASVVELADKAGWRCQWTNGIFVASAAAVKKHSPDVYLELMRTLIYQAPESCHYLERLWQFIFGQF